MWGDLFQPCVMIVSANRTAVYQTIGYFCDDWKSSLCFVVFFLQKGMMCVYPMIVWGYLGERKNVLRREKCCKMWSDNFICLWCWGAYSRFKHFSKLWIKSENLWGQPSLIISSVHHRKSKIILWRFFVFLSQYFLVKNKYIHQSAAYYWKLLKDKRCEEISLIANGIS